MEGKQIFETYESEVRSYCRVFDAVLSTAKGAVITDTEGKDYIDFFCGAGALNYGHNNPEIKEKVMEYLAKDGILHALDMYTEPKAAFIEYFENDILKPRGLDYKIMFPGPTGTNAVEAALKLARKVKKRNNIWCFMGCFHGMTTGALALTTEREAREGAGVPLNYVTHIPAPYMFPELDVIEYMQTMIDDDHSGIEYPAALIMETVQAEGGIRVFSEKFLQDVRAFCDKNDILLIIDDIQVGCGRTGNFFSFERAGIAPDILVISKSIGGLGFPFALTLFKPELDVWSPGEHNGTFRGNQIAIVSAKAAAEYYNNHALDAETKRKGALIEDFLNKEIKLLKPEFEVRGIGFIWGIDVHDEALAKKISIEAFKKGVIVERAGRKNEVVKIMPPLIIEDEVLLKGLQILKSVIEELV